jgi:hypothetical protein
MTSVTSLSVEDRKKLRNAVQEMSDSMTRIAAERDLQKEILSKIHEDLSLDKKVVRRLAKVYHKANFKDEVEQNDAFETFYNEVLS